VLLIIDELDLNADLILKRPYIKSQREAIPKITFECSLTKSLKKYEIPPIPRIIRKVSAIEQNRAA
jgi:hypothetical protein